MQCYYYYKSAHYWAQKGDIKMSIKVFVLKDDKHGTFKTPFFNTHVGDVLRSVEVALRDPKSTISQFPYDYSLWELGNFEESTGLFALLLTPNHICPVASLLPVAPSNNGHQPVKAMQND